MPVQTLFTSKPVHTLLSRPHGALGVDGRGVALRSVTPRPFTSRLRRLSTPGLAPSRSTAIRSSHDGRMRKLMPPHLWLLDMTERKSSRRALLRYGSVAAVASLAGCLWGNGDESPNGEQNGDENPNGDGNGEETPNYAEAFDLAGDGAALFREWLVPGNPVGSQDGLVTVFGYQDFESEDAEGVNSMGTYRAELARTYGIDAADIAGELVVGDPNSSRDRRIHLGEFDPETVVGTFEEAGTAEQVDEYRDYTIIEGQQSRGAVGPDAILVLPNYEAYIDAKHADGERLIDVDQPAGHLLDVLPRGFQITASRHENLEDLLINGASYHEVDEDGNPARTTRAFVFRDESSATTERAREIIEIGNTGYEEIISEEQHGRMVMTEFIQDWGGGESSE